MAKSFAIYYHIWVPPLSSFWRFMVDEQLRRLSDNNIPALVDVFCCISSSAAGEVVDYISQYPWINIIEIENEKNQYEGLTLKHLYSDCMKNPDLSAVCYIHTKGISYLSADCAHSKFKAINSWRHLLEWATIDKWLNSIERLNHFDLVGASFSSHPWPHIVGNMWWANPHYIRSLCPPTEMPPPPLSVRHRYEAWVGSNAPRGYGFLQHGSVDMYNDDIAPKLKNAVIHFGE